MTKIFIAPKQQTFTEENLYRQIAHFEQKIKELTKWLEEKPNSGSIYTTKYVECESYKNQLKQVKEQLSTLTKF